MEKIPKGTEITDSIAKHMDRRFLSSMDLMGLGDVELTIDRVEMISELKYLNGNKDSNVLLMYFKGTDKPLKLCKTNVKSIILTLKTANVSEWKGKKIKLCVKTVQAFGKPTPAVRIAD